MTILYVLAQHDFFTRGPRGRVSHAIGFASGVAQNQIGVTILSGPNSEWVKNEVPQAEVSSTPKSWLAWWLAFPFILLREVWRHDVTVIRWRPLWFIWGFVLALVPRRRVWFEVNTPTGLHSRLAPVRFLTRTSLRVVLKCFNVVVVSEASREQLLRIAKSGGTIFVLPNGFRSEMFEEFGANLTAGVKPTVVYFGKRQPYYDWDLLYQALEDTRRGEGPGLDFVVYGFVEEGRPDRFAYNGPLPQKELLDALRHIVNPVLILPASDSAIARSGSPMKLFEYAALGVPAIVSSSMNRQISGFSSFLVYEAGDRQSLTSMLACASERYESLLVQAGEGRRRALDLYSWRALTRRWLDVAVPK